MQTVHDEAAVNSSAIFALKSASLLANASDCICWPHVISGFGKKIECKKVFHFQRSPIPFNILLICMSCILILQVDAFLILWGALFNQSPMARGKYLTHVKRPCPWISNDIRWYIVYEVVVRILEDWNKIGSFLKFYMKSHDSKAVQNLIEVFDGTIIPFISS